MKEIRGVEIFESIDDIKLEDSERVLKSKRQVSDIEQKVLFYEKQIKRNQDNSETGVNEYGTSASLQELKTRLKYARKALKNAEDVLERYLKRDKNKYEALKKGFARYEQIKHNLEEMDRVSDVVFGRANTRHGIQEGISFKVSDIEINGKYIGDVRVFMADRSSYFRGETYKHKTHPHVDVNNYGLNNSLAKFWGACMGEGERMIDDLYYMRLEGRISDEDYWICRAQVTYNFLHDTRMSDAYLALHDSYPSVLLADRVREKLKEEKLISNVLQFRAS